MAPHFHLHLLFLPQIYDGGVAAKAGLSCNVHAYDFEFLADPEAAIED